MAGEGGSEGWQEHEVKGCDTVLSGGQGREGRGGDVVGRHACFQFKGLQKCGGIVSCGRKVRFVASGL